MINWGTADTTANIGVGPGNILYYTDGAWAPLLRVYDRSTGTVLQTFYIDGPSSGFGFGDFALNAAKTQLFGWAQYGWSAGSLSCYIGKFSVAANGTLAFVEKTSSTYPTTLSRDPLETPVLIGGDKVFIKQVMVNPAAISTVDRSFSGPVYSITPGGEIAVTTNAIFQTSTGNKLYDLPITTSVHAITSDYSRLVYYTTTTRTITSLDLIAAIGSEVMGRTLSPSDGSIVLPPSTLSWAGRLADGEVVTGSSLLGAAGDIPLYQFLYTAKGSVLGSVRCESGAALGTLRWAKDDHSTKPGRLYKSGIPAHLIDVSGGRYVRPAAGTPLIAGLMDASNNAYILFTEGALAVSIDQLLTLTKAQTVERPSAGAANPHDVRLTLTATTGMFSGSFVLKDVNPANVSQMLTRTVSFSGCLIPGQDRGVGYFLLPELPVAGVKGSALTNTPMWSGAVELISAN